MNELLRRILFLPPQASRMAAEIDGLHYFVITVTMLSSTLVGAVAWTFIVRYRERRPHRDTTTRVEAPLSVEIPLVGGVLALFLLWWVLGFRQYVRIETPPPGALDVYVTAKQWMWKFTYVRGSSAVERLTVPLGRPVRLVMTSRDVIHSFYVPALRVKQDVIPGRYTTLWFSADRAGVYPIYCAEYCGVSHSRMRGELVVLPDDAYDAWLAGSEGQTVADRSTGPEVDTDLARLGERVAARRACFACHTTDGQRHLGPSWRDLYASEVTLEDGRTVAADESYLTRSMMDPGADVVRGYRPIMPSYLGLIDEPETAALVEYIKSLRDTAPAAGVVLPPVAAAVSP